MPILPIAILSIALYAFIFWAIFRKKVLRSFRQWPRNPTLFIIWTIWVIFLLLFAPLSYYKGDMAVWTTATQNLLRGELLPDPYVYLPIYGQILAALAWPFHLLGLDFHIGLVFIVKWVLVFAYIGCAILMSKFVPEQSELAPLAIVLAPVTVFYIFFGTNHLVMFFFLLASLVFLRQKRWLLAGVMAALSCYKFLMVPTVFVLLVLVWIKAGWRSALWFIMGGVIVLIPNIVYYAYDPQNLLRVVSSQAAIGAHSDKIEPFHFFYLLSQSVETFESWYIGTKTWLWLSLAGIPISLGLYWLKRLTFLQCLALGYAFVAIFAPEPFRLEPLVGLLWLDAVYRGSLKVQTAIFVILFVHAFAWYDLANSAFLSFDPAVPDLWLGRGLFLGLAIIVTFGIILLEKDKRELVQIVA
jgi:hypothetical protein